VNEYFSAVRVRARSGGVRRIEVPSEPAAMKGEEATEWLEVGRSRRYTWKYCVGVWCRSNGVLGRSRSMPGVLERFWAGVFGRSIVLLIFFLWVYGMREKKKKQDSLFVDARGEEKKTEVGRISSYGRLKYY